MSFLRTIVGRVIPIAPSLFKLKQNLTYEMYTNGTQNSMVEGRNYNVCKAINYVKELATTLICETY